MCKITLWIYGYFAFRESSVWQGIAKYNKDTSQYDKGFVIVSFVGKFCKGKKAKFITPKCFAVSFLVRLRCKKCLNLA